MKIYTKIGDDGTTGIYGKRLSKSDPIIEALGTIDELNAYLGTIDVSELSQIQDGLMRINSNIAGFNAKIPPVDWLEKEIDKMEKNLPELKNFILPKGPIQYARTICRRAERTFVNLNSKFEIRNSKLILKYLNRLGDYLFVLARRENMKLGLDEIVWK